MFRRGAKEEKPSTPRRRIPGMVFVRKGINLRNIGIVAVLLFIFRNFFYEGNQLDYFMESGMDGLERYIPKTIEERREYVANKGNDAMRMKKDIAFLLQEVHELRSQVKANKHSRKDEVSVMDPVHMSRRKEHEAQYEAEHPGAVPGRTNRLRGEGETGDTSTA